ncbi:MAG: choice-of-anchor Q domain-containing protein, partial [Blastocatellia bacterium]
MPDKGRFPDIEDYASSYINNLIGIGDGLGFEDGEGANIVGNSIRPANPRLGPLTDNGRGIPTHSLLPESRAINAGDAAFLDNWWRDLFRTDQRGAERIFNKAVDMGSVEYGASQLPLTSAVLGRIEGPGGRAVSRAVITLRFPNGETRSAITNPFGYYRFAPVPADAEYSVEVSDKRLTFKPQTL